MWMIPSARAHALHVNSLCCFSVAFVLSVSDIVFEKPAPCVATSFAPNKPLLFNVKQALYYRLAHTHTLQLRYCN